MKNAQNLQRGYIADCRCPKCERHWVELDEKLDRQDRCPSCQGKRVIRKKQR